jgi:tetratricopeptide (TPR) repeat protein
MKRYFLLIAAALLSTKPSAQAHGDAHEAIVAVSTLIAKTPDDAALFFRRAEMHLKHGDLNAAEMDFLQARKLQPNLEVVSLSLARVRMAQGREKEALQLLNSFLERNPDHSVGRALRAGWLDKKGEWKKAEADLRAAAAASPEPQYATEHAQLLERHGQAAEAVRCLDAASKARGRVPVLEQQALEIQERAGLTAAALMRLDDFIALEPRPDIWLVRKACLLEKGSRMAEARIAWDQAAAVFAKIPGHKQQTKANQALAKQIETARNIANTKAP